MKRLLIADPVPFLEPVTWVFFKRNSTLKVLSSPINSCIAPLAVFFHMYPGDTHRELALSFKGHMANYMLVTDPLSQASLDGLLSCFQHFVNANNASTNTLSFLHMEKEIPNSRIAESKGMCILDSAFR